MNSSSHHGSVADRVAGGYRYTGTVMEVVQAFLVGLSPLLPLAIIVLLTTGLTSVARQLTAGAGFYTQQWVAVILVVLGLLLGIASVIVFSRRAFRAIKGWQYSGRLSQANAALVGLVVVALVLVLPVVLAILAPQHPAPNLAP
jgi:hypothetical protein